MKVVKTGVWLTQERLRVACATRKRELDQKVFERSRYRHPFNSRPLVFLAWLCLMNNDNDNDNHNHYHHHHHHHHHHRRR